MTSFTRKTFLAISTSLLGASAGVSTIPRPLRAVGDELSAGVDYLGGHNGFVKEVIRAEDFLSLKLAFIELGLVNDNPNPYRLWRPYTADSKQPSLIVLHFPPQHLAEQVYGVATICSTAGCKKKPDNTPSYRRLSGESRISFIFDPSRLPNQLSPDGRSISFLLESVLSACEYFDQVIWTPDTGQSATITQTAIEAPYRMLLGPNSSGFVRLHAALAPDDGTVELWRAEVVPGITDANGYLTAQQCVNIVNGVAYGFEDCPVTLRAIEALAPESVDPDVSIDGCMTPLDSEDRRQLVQKMNAVSQEVASNAGGLAVADRCILTGLGAFLSLGYRDTAPLAPGTPPNNIREWQHIISQGRDEKGVVVYTFFALPYGHKLSVIETTERVFEDGGAYLYRHYNIRCDEPTKSFIDKAARALGFTSVTLRLGGVNGPNVSPDVLPAFIGLTSLRAPGVPLRCGTDDFVIPAVLHDSLGAMEYEVELIKTDMKGNALPPVRAALALVNETTALRISDKNVMNQVVEFSNALMSRSIGQLDMLAADVAKFTLSAQVSMANLTSAATLVAPKGIEHATEAAVGSVFTVSGSPLRIRCTIPGAVGAMSVNAPDLRAYDVFSAGEATFEVLPTMAEAAFRREVNLADLESAAKRPAEDLEKLFTQSATFRADIGSLENLEENGANWFQPKLGVARVRIKELAAVAGAADLAYIELTEDYIFPNGGPYVNGGVFAQAVQEQAKAALSSAAAQAQQQAVAAINSGLKSLSAQVGPILGQITEPVTNIAQFDPSKAFADFGSGFPKLLGILNLSDLIKDVVPIEDVIQKNAKIPNLTVERRDGRVIAVFDYTKNISIDDDTSKVGLIGDSPTLTLHMEASTRSDGSDPQRSVKATITNIRLQIIPALSMLELYFRSISFTSATNTSIETHLDGMSIKIPTNSILGLLNELASYLNPGGNLPTFSFSTDFVNADYALHLPDIPLGAFTISNVHLELGADIPISDMPLGFTFGLATQDHPFNVAVGIFGGGGYFELTTKGLAVNDIVGGIDVSVSGEIDLVVARGQLLVAFGVSYDWQATTLSGYLTGNGSASVLDLITATLTFNAYFSYDFHTHTCSGGVTYIVSISLCFFSLDVPVTLAYSFSAGGSSSNESARIGASSFGITYPQAQAPMKFTQQYSVGQWKDYCEAFA